MDNIVFGKYIPLDSPIHNLDPRAKIMGMLIIIVAIFIPTGSMDVITLGLIPMGYVGYILIGLVIADCVYLSKLKMSYIWKAMKPMLFMLVFLLIVNVLVLKTGTLLVTFFGISIYSGAISQTLYIVLRLLFMITITTVLTATTKPLDLTLGIEDLLSPFRRVGVPSHIIAMMISIALRFIPTLIEEAQRIMKAQASRGVDLEEGKFKEKVMSILSLIVPLLISAFQRAEDLSNAMEARGYSPDIERTRYKQLSMRLEDYVMMTFAILVLGLIIMVAIL